VVKPFGGRGSAPDPAGAYSAPPDPLAGKEGADCPIPKNLTLALGPSGHTTTASGDTPGMYVCMYVCLSVSDNNFRKP